MTDRPVAAAASIARGLAVIAMIVALVVSARLLAGLASGGESASHAACTTPVELEDLSGRLITCADDRRLAACGALSRGDRAVVHAGTCAVNAGGMSGAARLLEGLPLDINRADAADLALLDGIGPAISAAIVESRDTGGRFGSIAALQRVRGIGPATVEKLRPFVTVGTERQP
ncbi:MAG: helix-hairpin-helix domain-containing protein [Myxococcota bacterium]